MLQSRLCFMRFSTAFIVLAAAGPALSQQDTTTLDASQPAVIEADLPPESPDDWQYQATISLPNAASSSPAGPTADSNLMDVFVSAEILGNSRHDLSDLRLDAVDGSSVPFAVRTLSARTVNNDLQASTFNQAQTDTGIQEVTLELTGTQITHNQVLIETSGTEFRRLVVVEGSDEGQEWKKLVQGFVLKLSGDDPSLSRSTLRYQESRHRFLRIKVEPDPQLTTSGIGSDGFEISSVRVAQQFEIPAELVSTIGSMSPREPTRQYGSPGSRWIIDFGYEIPVERLEVSISDSEFARDVSLEAETLNMLGQPEFYTVYPNDSSTWQRQQGEPVTDLALTFDELRTRRLRLTVVDYRNKPLTLTGAKGIAPARQLVFQSPNANLFPLKLRIGNPAAENPNYDFARNLSEVLPIAPIRGVLEAAQKNPSYVAPRKPFTERYPWFIYLTLAAVCMVLGAVVLNLSKAAVALHDADEGLSAASKI